MTGSSNPIPIYYKLFYLLMQGNLGEEWERRNNGCRPEEQFYMRRMYP